MMIIIVIIIDTDTYAHFLTNSVNFIYCSVNCWFKYSAHRVGKDSVRESKSSKPALWKQPLTLKH